MINAGLADLALRAASIIALLTLAVTPAGQLAPCPARRAKGPQ